jgi:hypothetical protein
MIFEKIIIMDKNLFSRSIFFGFFTWLIPFTFSFFFYSPSGEVIIDNDLFKSIMIMIASITGGYFVFKYFKNVSTYFIKTGVTIGLAWFTMHLFLDIIILIPTLNLTFTNYFTSIGLRYMLIPAISITTGYLFHKKSKTLIYRKY